MLKGSDHFYGCWKMAQGEKFVRLSRESAQSPDEYGANKGKALRFYRKIVTPPDIFLKQGWAGSRG